jgi:hypothetical protein
MKEYNIAPRTGVCNTTQRALEEGEEFYAVLFDVPEGFERRDYCLAAWEGPPEGFFCYFKSRVPQKEEKKRRFVDTEIMVNLFQRLAESDDEVKQHFRFVLALILMRKRVLKYLRTIQENDGEFWEMRVSGEDELFLVRNPKLTDEQIEKVSRELGAILHGDTSMFDDLDAGDAESRTEPQTQET